MGNAVHSGHRDDAPRGVPDPVTPLRYYLLPEAAEKGLEVRVPRSGDAGFDLPCLCEVVIPPKGFAAVRTGVHVAIPERYVGIIRDRSGVALQGGVTVAGVIDAGYRGEIKVLLYNLGESDLRFQIGDRIAQLILLEHHAAVGAERVETLEALGRTVRGAGGFGSTG